MASVKEPPKWAHAAACYNCQKQFGLIARKHHCRNCGNTFCAQCSTKRIPIPEFGLVTQERVCDKCYDLVKAEASGAKSERSERKQAREDAAQAAASSEEKGEQKSEAKKPARKKDCSCGAPLCVCPPDPSEAPAAVEPEASDAPSEKPKPKPVSKADSNYAGATPSAFQGFGQQSQKQWDLKGNLNEQCRDAVKAGDVEGVKTLLKAGAKADYKDRTGNTLAHLAAMFNRLDLVEVLHSHGADLHVKNPDGETPIDLAPPALGTRMKALSPA